MKFNISSIALSAGLVHTETKWDIKEYNAGTLVKHVTYNFGEKGLLSVEYPHIDSNNIFVVTVVRKFNDGTVTSPFTETLGTSCGIDLPAPFVTTSITLENTLSIFNDNQEIIFTSLDAKNYLGLTNHTSSTWTVRDSAGVVIYSRDRSPDDLTSIRINKRFLTGVGVTTIDVIYHDDDGRSSNRATLDFYLEDIQPDVEKGLTSFYGSKILPVNTFNTVSFNRDWYANLEYRVVAKKIDGTVLLDTITKTGNFILPTTGVKVNDNITVHITTTTKTSNPINIDYTFTIVNKLDMSLLNAVNFDGAFTKNLIGNLNVRLDLDETDTIELPNGLTPVFDKDNKRLNFFGVTDSGVAPFNSYYLQLEDIESLIELDSYCKIRLVDNSMLVVAYISTDTSLSTPKTSLELRFFNFYPNEVIENSLILSKSNTIEIGNAATYRDKVNKIMLSTPDNNVLSYATYIGASIPVKGNITDYTPDTSATSTTPYNISQLYDLAVNSFKTIKYTIFRNVSDKKLKLYKDGTTVNVSNAGVGRVSVIKDTHVVILYNENTGNTKVTVLK